MVPDILNEALWSVFRILTFAKISYIIEKTYMYGRIISIQRICIDYIAYFMYICKAASENLEFLRHTLVTSPVCTPDIPWRDVIIIVVRDTFPLFTYLIFVTVKHLVRVHLVLGSITW
jgi:hypothetical protein